VAEWFKAAVLKTARGVSPSWVRIPPLPPDTFDPIGVYCQKSRRPWPLPMFCHLIDPNAKMTSGWAVSVAGAPAPGGTGTLRSAPLLGHGLSHSPESGAEMRDWRMTIEMELAEARMLLAAISEGRFMLRLRGKDVSERERMFLSREIAALEKTLARNRGVHTCRQLHAT
jgi:hypothetical protein